MKKWKKTLCVVLIAVLVLALTALCACGSFTPRMTIAMQKFNALNSFHTDTTLTAELTITTFGVETPVSFVATAAGDHQKDPAITALDLSATVFDVTEDMLLVVEKTEDRQTVYTSFDGGKVWVSESHPIGSEADGESAEAAPDGESAGAAPAGQAAAEAPAEQKLSAADLLKLAVALSENFEETGLTEIVDEDGAAGAGVRYEGTIPAELLRQLLAGTDALATLAELSARYDLPLDVMAVDLITDVPAAVELDRESNTLLRVEFDLTAFFNGILDQTLQAVLAKYELPDDTIELRIDSVRVETDFSGFDSVTIEAPRAYKASA